MGRLSGTHGGVESWLREYASVNHPDIGRIYAYEVDGLGNSYCVDDSNVPSLLALSYIGAVKPNDTVPIIK